jgi:hypothetical protein
MDPRTMSSLYDSFTCLKPMHMLLISYNDSTCQLIQDSSVMFCTYYTSGERPRKASDDIVGELQSQAGEHMQFQRVLMVEVYCLLSKVTVSNHKINKGKNKCPVRSTIRASQARHTRYLETRLLETQLLEALHTRNCTGHTCKCSEVHRSPY